MKEGVLALPSDNWERRQKIGRKIVTAVFVLSSLSLAATATDLKVTNNALDRKVEDAYPQTIPDPLIAGYKEKITAFTREVDRQVVIVSPTVANIPQVVNSPTFRQALNALQEEGKRREKASALRESLTSLRTKIEEKIVLALSTLALSSGFWSVALKFQKHTSSMPNKK